MNLFAFHIQELHIISTNSQASANALKLGGMMCYNSTARCTKITATTQSNTVHVHHYPFSQINLTCSLSNMHFGVYQ